MKRATMFTIYLAVWITLLFIVGMSMTFFNDWLQQTGFFADTVFVPYKNQYGILVDTCGEVDQTHVWGARHYWYNILCIILFVLSIVRIILFAYYYWDAKPKPQTP